MLFWVLLVFISLIILYSYKVHFLNGGFLEVKEFLQQDHLKKKMNCECVFEGSFFFKIAMYDVYEDENFLILIKNYGLLNGLIQKMFPENYIVVKNEAVLEEDFKVKFLKYIRIDSMEHHDGVKKIKGQLYTKLFFSNDFNHEREVILSIR